MGLDMWLKCNSRKVCEAVNDQNDEWEWNFNVPRGIAIYWRKANAIHNWFVTNLKWGEDDCKPVSVELSDLIRLHDAIVDVLGSTHLVEPKGDRPINPGVQVLEDTSVAERLLPTKSGFFFGSTEYDSYYWWDLELTRDKLAAIIDCLVPFGELKWDVCHKDEPDWVVRFTYESSW